jgi:Dyp-type peroxidase family
MQPDKLQSNILKSHNRKHVVLLPLRFTAPADKIREWISAFSRQHVTSASQQGKEIDHFRQTRQDAGSVLGNFYISPFGYTALGLDPEQLDSELFPDVQVTFSKGMAAYAGELNDPPQIDWEESYRDRIDAMILLAANDAGNLLAECANVLLGLQKMAVAEPRTIEVGKALFNESGQRIEHFGFVDGISDPHFTEVDPAGGTRQQWDPRADVDLVLAKDPFAPEPDCWGSFLVYRKLEQDVKKFKDLVRNLARQLTNGDEMFAKAMVVGRFPNGSPLVLSGRDDHPGTNDFDYRDDRDGSRCPFHSHIRKMTPRGGSDRPLEEERSSRIARRGITYGRRSPRLDDEPEAGVGTLFLCFQHNISRQFAFLQKRWANRLEFPRQGVGIDPFSGRVAAAASQQWPTAWDQPGRVGFDLSRVVTLKGGEFFFAPSLPFLRNLGATPDT